VRGAALALGYNERARPWSLQSLIHYFLPTMNLQKLIIALGLATGLLFGQPLAFAATPASTTQEPHFDPKRDPAADLVAALTQAKQQNKRIILDVGGDWCVWCLRMDKFIAENEAVQKSIDAHFVWLKVNYSDENKNQAFLSKYPKIKGYPHLFVLDANGTVLQSQNTGDLEQGKGYGSERFLQFLDRWSSAMN
jgi:thiol:disulfide interchange protein